MKRDPAAAVADSLKVIPHSVDAFEGPNELDNSGDPAWPATLRAYMPKLGLAVIRQARGVPVIGPSFIDPANRSRIPSELPGLINGHPYPGGAAPEPALGAGGCGDGPGTRSRARRAWCSPRPATTTRWARQRGPAAGLGGLPRRLYFPRLLLDAFGLGARRTFIYELLDEKPDPALTRRPAALRPAAQRLHAEARVHGDQDPDRRGEAVSRAGDRHKLDWTLSGAGRARESPGLPS